MIDNQYCSFISELIIYTEFILEYIYYLMITIVCRRYPVGGGNSLGLLSLRPLAFRIGASVKTGGGGLVRIQGLRVA